MELAAWVDQAVRQAKGRPAVVIHKRRGVASPSGWYVTLTGADLLRLIGENNGRGDYSDPTSGRDAAR